MGVIGHIFEQLISNDVVKAINCGGSAYIAFNGIKYEPDTGFESSSIAFESENDIADTMDTYLFKSMRKVSFYSNISSLSCYTFHFLNFFFFPSLFQ